jgi:hypothetical protein
MKADEPYSMGQGMTCRPTRRRFLAWLLGSLALGAPFASRLARADADLPLRDTLPWLDRLIPHPESAARLGRSYLEAHPEHADRPLLLSNIERAAMSGLGSASTPADPAQLVAGLQQAVRRDYAQGEVVSVDGWILSITEAQLYALAAMR